MNTVEIYAASLNKDQVITAVSDILPRAQACIESDGWGEDLILNFFYRGYFVPKCPTLRNTDNIIITV